MALLALLPLVLFAALLVGVRWSAAQAGGVAALLALVLAINTFSYPMSVAALAGPLLEATFTAATILWIILPALAIYEWQERTGQTQLIGRWLASVSPSPQITALLVGWFFALFLEGAAGFGTPVALAAPLLVSLGFPPVRALLCALIGHAAGVSFGAVGTPMMPLLHAATVDPRTLSLLILLLHGMLGWILAVAVYRLARTGEERPEKPAGWLAVPAAVLLFFVPAALFAACAGPELPTLGGALVGAVLFVLLTRRGAAAPGAPAHTVPGRALLKAALPYVLILALILATRLAGPLRTTLQRLEIGWTLTDSFGGSVAILYHPGTMLALALLLTAAVKRDSGAILGSALKAAAGRLPPVALALITVLLMARIMVHSGMIDALAEGAGRLLGAAWPVAVPLVGALGSFITGSATASNIVFTGFQTATAATTGLPVALALAGQSLGSAIGNIVAPHNIVAGAATVGLIGREGEVMKRTLPLCLAYTLAGGVIVLLLALFAGF